MVQWVLQPGSGLDGPYVYDTLAELIAGTGIATVPGERFIDVDLSLASNSYDVPAGTYDFGPNVNFVGIPFTLSTPTLNFPAGVVFTNPPASITDIIFLGSQSTNLISISGEAKTIRLSGSAVLESNNTGGGALVNVGIGGILHLVMSQFAALEQSDSSSAPAVRTSDPAGDTHIDVFDDGLIGPGAFSFQSTDQILVSDGANQVDGTYAPVVLVTTGVCWTAVLPTPVATVNAAAAGAEFANTDGGIGTTLWVARAAGTGSWFNLA
jgi:hypothetical protein